MSMTTLNRVVLAESKSVLNNPKLKDRDILEWSTASVKADAGQVTVRLPDLQINICVPVACDKRLKTEEPKTKDGVK